MRMELGLNFEKKLYLEKLNLNRFGFKERELIFTKFKQKQAYQKIFLIKFQRKLHKNMKNSCEFMPHSQKDR